MCPANSTAREPVRLGLPVPFYIPLMPQLTMRRVNTSLRYECGKPGEKLRMAKPSCLRETASSVPNVRWRISSPMGDGSIDPVRVGAISTWVAVSIHKPMSTKIQP